jgi:hypothetical protein
LGFVIRLTSYAGFVKRRPSFATVVALLALFVALGGPAEAQKLLRKGSVTSLSIKDRSVKLSDLSRKTVRKLQATRNGSITEAKLANGSVSAAKLAPGAVGSAAIADGSIGAIDLATGSVGGTQVANGSLSAADLGRFWGRFRSTIGPIEFGKCWSGEPTGLAPELAGADISNDLVLVMPDDRWIERRVTFSVRASSISSRFVLAACNVGVPIDGGGPATVDEREIGFRYVIIDLP